MKEKNIFLLLVAITLLLSPILFTNMGYAKENITIYSSNNLSQDINVKFNKNSKYLSNNIDIIDSQTASLKPITFTKIGETQKFQIPIINTNSDTSLKIQVSAFNSNPDYFNVTYHTSKSVLNKKLDEAIIEITVELIKTPLYSNETTEITIKIFSESIYKNNS